MVKCEKKEDNKVEGVIREVEREEVKAKGDARVEEMPRIGQGMQEEEVDIKGVGVPVIEMENDNECETFITPSFPQSIHSSHVLGLGPFHTSILHY